MYNATQQTWLGISIHALLAESDAKKGSTRSDRKIFLSTLSLRRATQYFLEIFFEKSYFYPRSPCGERPWAQGSRVTYVEISIHALLAESDSGRTFEDQEYP